MSVKSTTAYNVIIQVTIEWECSYMPLAVCTLSCCDHSKCLNCTDNDFLNYNCIYTSRHISSSNQPTKRTNERRNERHSRVFCSPVQHWMTGTHCVLAVFCVNNRVDVTRDWPICRRAIASEIANARTATISQQQWKRQQLWQTHTHKFATMCYLAFVSHTM